MPHTAQIIIALLGAVTVALSAYLAVHFWRAGRELGAALGLMLGAEAVMGAVTLTYALAPVVGYEVRIGPWGDVAMRTTIFTAAAVTSAHLAWKIHKLHAT